MSANGTLTITTSIKDADKVRKEIERIGNESGTTAKAILEASKVTAQAHKQAEAAAKSQAAMAKQLAAEERFYADAARRATAETNAKTAASKTSTEEAKRAVEVARAEAIATNKAAAEIKAINEALKKEAIEHRNTEAAAKAKIATMREEAMQQRKLLNEIKDSTAGAHEHSKGIHNLMNNYMMLQMVLMAIGPIFKPLTDGFKSGSNFESMTLAIAGLVATNETITDQYGRQLEGSEKIFAAQKQTKEVMNDIQRDAILTTATTEELVRGFQAMVGPGLSAGMALKEIEKTAVSGARAMGALNIPMDQMDQELRSILDGTIDRNSRLAKALRITNEEINKHKRAGDIYEFLALKFKDLDAAGQLAGRTFAGLTSTLADIYGLFTRNATAQPFKEISADLGRIVDSLIKIDSMGEVKLDEKVNYGAIRMGAIASDFYNAAKNISGLFMPAVTNAMATLDSLYKTVKEIAIYSSYWAAYSGAISGGANPINAVALAWKQVREEVEAINNLSKNAEMYGPPLPDGYSYDPTKRAKNAEDELRKANKLAEARENLAIRVAKASGDARRIAIAEAKHEEQEVIRSGLSQAEAHQAYQARMTEFTKDEAAKRIKAEKDAAAEIERDRRERVRQLGKQGMLGPLMDSVDFTEAGKTAKADAKDDKALDKYQALVKEWYRRNDAERREEILAATKSVEEVMKKRVSEGFRQGISAASDVASGNFGNIAGSLADALIGHFGEKLADSKVMQDAARDFGNSLVKALAPVDKFFMDLANRFVNDILPVLTNASGGVGTLLTFAVGATLGARNAFNPGNGVRSMGDLVNARDNYGNNLDNASARDAYRKELIKKHSYGKNIFNLGELGDAFLNGGDLTVGGFGESSFDTEAVNRELTNYETAINNARLAQEALSNRLREAAEAAKMMKDVMADYVDSKLANQLVTGGITQAEFNQSSAYNRADSRLNSTVEEIGKAISTKGGIYGDYDGTSDTQLALQYLKEGKTGMAEALIGPDFVKVLATALNTNITDKNTADVVKSTADADEAKRKAEEAKRAMPGSSPNNPSYTVVTNAKDFFAFMPQGGFFRASGNNTQRMDGPPLPNRGVNVGKST